MKVAIFNTEGFLAWVSGKPAPHPAEMSLEAARKAVAKAFCALVSKKDVRGERQVLVVDTQRMRDFYAFTSTYILDYTPFSAFFRVISTDHLQLLHRDGLFESSGGSVESLRPFTGIAIAEAACYLLTKGNSIDDLSVSAVGSTYSAAIIQGLNAGASIEITAIGRAWVGVRSQLGGEELSLPVSELQEFWALVGGMISGRLERAKAPVHRTVIDMMMHTFSTKTFGSDQLGMLAGLLPDLKKPISRLRGPREDRTRAVQEAIGLLMSDQSLSPLLKGCLAGCVISLLGDGSFQFFPLSLSVAQQFPTTPLWFAAWSAVMAGNDVLTASKGLGRRVARDLLSPRDVFDEPTDDISLEELRTIGNEVNSLPRTQPSTLSVEIFPLVSSRVRIAQPSNAPAVQRSDQQEKDLKELRKLISQSSDVLARIESAGRFNSTKASGAKNATTKRKFI